MDTTTTAGSGSTREEQHAALRQAVAEYRARGGRITYQPDEVAPAVRQVERLDPWTVQEFEAAADAFALEMATLGM